MSIEVVCRRCGRKAPAEEFRVDHVYKLAVCRVCYTEREKSIPKKVKEEPTLKELMEQKKETEEKNYEIKKSKIFDETDEYLERAVQKKKEKIREQKDSVIRTRKLTHNKVLYPCQRCNYKFKYNLETQRPLVCPYCETKVSHNITF